MKSTHYTGDTSTVNHSCRWCEDFGLLNYEEMQFYSETLTGKRMPSSGMCRHVAHVRRVISEERIVSIINGKRITKLGRKVAVTSN
jgi:hypothetical protein